MALINGMVTNEYGGVCLIKNLHYFSYESITTGCTCEINITEVTENVPTSIYILPYINKNTYYSVDFNNHDICLNIGVQPIGEWVDSYINSITTTGNTETRIIYSELDGKYYKMTQDNTSIHCTPDIISRWAIVDYNTEDIWLSGSTYYIDILNSCGNQTGERVFKLKDINPMSNTYNEIITVTKCQNETTPICITNNATDITTNEATLNGNTISDGGFLIIEKGFCYSTLPTATINDKKVINSGDIGLYSDRITNLSGSSRYYFRSYAINVLGISYGNEMSFETL